MDLEGKAKRLVKARNTASLGDSASLIRVLCGPTHHGEEMRVLVVVLDDLLQLFLVLLQQPLGVVLRHEGLELGLLGRAVVALLPPRLELLPDLDDELLDVLRLQHFKLLQFELQLKKKLS